MWFEVIVTAYCACSLCCGPHVKGITSSGAKVRSGVTLAAPRSIPFGTRVWVDGIGWRVVQDRLHRKYDHRFDLYMTRHRDARRFGIQTRRIFIPATL